jgi:hypothetical protein
VRHKTYISALLAFLAISLLSCSEDFLDEPQNTNGISEENAFSSRESVEAVVAGIMRNYRRQWDDNLSNDNPVDANDSRPDVGGLYAMYYARTVKGNDIIQTSTFFTFDYENDNRDSSFLRTRFTWFFNYQSINFANILIDGVTESDALSDDEKSEFIAIGKAIRAYHYFELALEFAPNFNNDRSIEVLPLYTSATRDIVSSNAPVSLSVIFNQITTDLTEALPDLPSTAESLGKSFIHKEFAYALYARVLQVTQDDWSMASQMARAAYGGNASEAVVSTNWGNGFNDLSDEEWIWGHFQNESETNFFFLAPHVFADHLSPSFSATFINPNFVNQFSDTDVRKLFADINNVSDQIPWMEFVTTKFAFTFESDAPLMRKSEMVLADAEAQFHLGNSTAAQDLLFTLQSERDPMAVRSGNTGQALLDEILFERRKELYGEIGVEWFDAKRYSLPIDRDPVHRVEVDIPADSELFFLQVPQNEIDANDAIDSSINTF